MADAAAPGLLPVAADRDRDRDDRRRWAARCGFAVLGIMSSLLVYGVLQVGWVWVAGTVAPPFLLHSLAVVYPFRPESPRQRDLLDTASARGIAA